MKRIIAAFDGLKYCESTAAYAIDVAKKCHAAVIGVFLEDVTYHSFSLVNMAEQDNAIESHTRHLSSADQQSRDHSVKLFIHSCKNARVKYTIHRDRNIAIQELLQESLFADLIIVQKKETLTHFSEDSPTRFIADLLERTSCPVLLVSEYYHPMEETLFLYDGGPSAMFALKQFSCIFSGKTGSLQVLSVRQEKQEQVLPDAHLFKEWVNDHFASLQYAILSGRSEEEIIAQLKREARYPVVILGAYGRSRASRWVRPSLADRIMNQFDLPLFIANQ